MRTILILIIGVLLGLAACIIPRFWNVDLFSYFVPAKIATAKSVVAGDKKQADPLVVPKEIELRRMIAEVAAQRTALTERERPLAEAAAKIELEKKSILALKQDVEDAEARIKSSVLEIDANELVNLKRLAKTWAQMDPSETAKLVKGLDLDITVKILGKMTEKQAAGVLGALTSEPDGEKLAVNLTNRLKQVKSATLMKEK